MKVWYNKLKPGQRLTIHFCIQWLYWFAAYWVMDKVWPDEQPKTMGSLLFTATWMGIFMTVFFEWKKVKALFTRNKTNGK